MAAARPRASQVISRARRSLRAYRSVVGAGIRSVMVYRASVLLTASAVAVSVGVQLTLWNVVYATSRRAIIAGFSIHEITTYLLAGNLLAAVLANQVDQDVGGEVYRGDVILSLLRPVSYPALCFAASIPVV